VFSGGKAKMGRLMASVALLSCVLYIISISSTVDCRGIDPKLLLSNYKRADDVGSLTVRAICLNILLHALHALFDLGHFLVCLIFLILFRLRGSMHFHFSFLF